MKQFNNLRPFKPGQSGNPSGRPKGSKHRLSEELIAALADDFAEHGKQAIVQVRTESPDQYLKIIASLVPKDLNVTSNGFEGMTDEDLVSEFRALILELEDAGYDVTVPTSDAVN